MNAKDLKNSILQLAIQGKLVEQRIEEGTAKELLDQIKVEREQLIKEKKIKKEKPLPAITEEEIPFDIPESWEWVRLPQILYLQQGVQVETAKQSPTAFENSIRFLRIVNFTQNSEEYRYVGSEYIKENALVNINTLVMVRYGATSGYIYKGKEGLLANNLFTINIISNDIFSTYIKKFFENPFIRNRIISDKSDTAMPSINFTSMNKLIIPLPPIEEQKRIVAKIEELMPYVEKYDKAYSEFEELNKKFPEDMQKAILQYAIQGKLVEQREEDGTGEELYQHIQEEKSKLIMEGKIKKSKKLQEITEDEIPFDIPESWKWVRLDDVFNITMGQSPKGTSVIEGDQGLEFHQGKVYFGENYIQRSNQSTNKPTKIVEPNTVLLCVRAPVGILNITEREICIGRGLCGINTLAEMNEKFVLYSLRAFKNDFVKKATGTTFIAITGEVVNNQLIPLPPLEEQKRIIDKIEELFPLTKQLNKQKI